MSTPGSKGNAPAGLKQVPRSRTLVLGINRDQPSADNAYIDTAYWHRSSPLWIRTIEPSQ